MTLENLHLSYSHVMYRSVSTFPVHMDFISTRTIYQELSTVPVKRFIIAIFCSEKKREKKIAPVWLKIEWHTRWKWERIQSIQIQTIIKPFPQGWNTFGCHEQTGIAYNRVYTGGFIASLMSVESMRYCWQRPLIYRNASQIKMRSSDSSKILHVIATVDLWSDLHDMILV